METTLVTCVICPKGCSISVDWEEKDGAKTVLAVRGNSCPRGLKYASAEVIHPERVLTSTVRVEDSDVILLPIRSATPIPKETMFLAMDQIAATVVKGPIKMGDVIIKDIAGTGIDMIACRNA